jgi:hypothetical protein
MPNRLPPSKRPGRDPDGGTFSADDVLRLTGEKVETAYMDALDRGFSDPVIVVGNFRKDEPRQLQVIQNERAALIKGGGEIGERLRNPLAVGMAYTVVVAVKLGGTAVKFIDRPDPR